MRQLFNILHPHTPHTHTPTLPLLPGSYCPTNWAPSHHFGWLSTCVSHEPNAFFLSGQIWLRSYNMLNLHLARMQCFHPWFKAIKLRIQCNAYDSKLAWAFSSRSHLSHNLLLSASLSPYFVANWIAPDEYHHHHSGEPWCETEQNFGNYEPTSKLANLSKLDFGHSTDTSSFRNSLKWWW